MTRITTNQIRCHRRISHFYDNFENLEKKEDNVRRSPVALNMPWEMSLFYNQIH